MAGVPFPALTLGPSPKGRGKQRRGILFPLSHRERAGSLFSLSLWERVGVRAKPGAHYYSGTPAQLRCRGRKRKRDSGFRRNDEEAPE